MKGNMSTCLAKGSWGVGAFAIKRRWRTGWHWTQTCWEISRLANRLWAECGSSLFSWLKLQFGLRMNITNRHSIPEKSCISFDIDLRFVRIGRLNEAIGNHNQREYNTCDVHHSSAVACSSALKVWLSFRGSACTRIWAIDQTQPPHKWIRRPWHRPSPSWIV
jgi:hypothetical protein